MPGFDGVPFEDIVAAKKEDAPAVKEVDMSLVAPTIKAEEMDEPLLRANPQRFVLFPIKYHEVCFPKPLNASLLARFTRLKCN